MDQSLFSSSYAYVKEVEVTNEENNISIQEINIGSPGSENFSATLRSLYATTTEDISPRTSTDQENNFTESYDSTTFLEPKAITQHKRNPSMGSDTYAKEDFYSYVNPDYGNLEFSQKVKYLDSDAPCRNWNKEFQEILRRDDSLQKYELLSNLGRDFIYTAKTYGRIIINELCLMNDIKSIKPRNMGGLAGGTKYVAQGILFKLVIDKHTLYKGDHYAMKAASAELRGLMSYYNCKIPGLLTPLMALIDYRGFRLTAIALLDIDNDTLVYGSADAGQTVKCENPIISQKMRQAAKLLNLKGHQVQDKTLYAAVDVEIHQHKVESDSYYVLDCARVFPPEAVTFRSREGSHLYYFLRPELVKSNSVPLSSDSFSQFSANDENRSQHNQEVKDCTLRLHKVVIPQYAKLIDEAPTRDKMHQLLKTDSLHRAGINLRHMGSIRQYLKSEEAKKLILTEVVARVLKNIIRKRFRDKIRALKLPSEAPYYQLVLDFINVQLMNSNHEFWSGELIRIMLSHFPNCLLDDEAMISLPNYVDKKLVLQRFLHLARIKLTKQAQQLLESSEKPTLIVSDIKKLGVHVSHMNIMYYAEAKLLYMKAIQSNPKDHELERFWKLSDDMFDRSVATSTDSQSTLFEWGLMLFQHAERVPITAPNYLERASEKYQIASTLGNITETNVLLDWATILSYWGWTQENTLTAEETFAKAANVLERAFILDSDCISNILDNIIDKQGILLGMFSRVVVHSELLELKLRENIEIIKSLNLSECKNLTENALFKLLDNCNNLSHLNLSKINSDMFTDFQLLKIARKHTDLQFLDLSYCNVTSFSVYQLANILKKLKTLKLTGCKIYENELVEIAKRFKSLQRYEISHHKAFVTIKGQCPHLVVEFVEFTLNPTTVLHNQYRIYDPEIEISQSKGYIYFGHLKKTNQPIHIKRLIDSDDVIYCNESEVKSTLEKLMKIRDSKFIPVLGMYVDNKDNSVQIVSELQHATTLKRYIETNREMSLFMRVRISYEIASACYWLYCHDDVVHPYLKTSNIFVVAEEASTVRLGSCYCSQAILKYRTTSNNDSDNDPIPPEISRYADYSESSTVYLYGNILNQLIHDLQPVPVNHPRLIQAVEKLNQLRDKCISPNPSDRPNFQRILQRLESALFDDIGLLKLWKSVNKNWKVSWDQFWREFLDRFAPVQHENLLKYEGLLKELLASSPNEDILERLYKLLDWFGPLDNPQFFSEIISLCKEEWFYGFLSKDETPNVLHRSKNNSFLVRFSTQIPGAFSVIFKWFFENSEEISRVRIVHVAKGYTFEDSQWRGRVFPSIAACVTFLQSIQLIKEPCIGSPYVKLIPHDGNRLNFSNSEEKLARRLSLNLSRS